MSNRALVLLLIVSVVASGTSSPIRACTKLDLLQITDMINGPLFLRWHCPTPPSTSMQIGLSCANCPPGGYAGQVTSAGQEWASTSSYFSFASGANNVIWVNENWPLNLRDPHAPGARAMAGTDPFTGFINSGAIWINEQQHDFSDVGEAGKVDFESVVLHEIGHMLGLVDVTCYSVMDNLVVDEVRRHLRSLDVEAIEALYCCGPNNLMLADGRLSEATSTCGDGNPATEISGLRTDGETATWTVWDERGTREYLVEGLHTPDGSGVILARERPGVGSHSVQLGDHAFPYIRLVEVENGGRRSVCDVAASRPAVGAFTDTLPSTVGEDAPSTQSPPPQLVPPSGEQVIIYTHESLVTPLLPLMQYWEGLGYQVSMYWSPHFFADEFELADQIAWMAQNGVKYFHIVGGWSDYFVASELWDATPYWRTKRENYTVSGRLQGTPDTGLSIPPTITPDAELGPFNTARSRPYIFSDQGYADVDGDGIPDVVVTRWPVTTSAQVQTLVSKVTSYGNALAAGTRRADRTTFFVGDMTSPNANGPEAVALSSHVKDRLLSTAPAQSTTIFLESDHLTNQANDTAAHLNSWNPDLLIMLSTFSTCEQPGSFFAKDGSPAWNMNLLTSGTQAALVAAASCNSAEYTTPCAAFAQPVCNDFLFTANKGALAWLGPTTGSWQLANYAVSRFLVEELFQNPYRPMAESWLVAMQRAYATFGTESDYSPTLDSYVFLGDPLSPFARIPAHEVVAQARKVGSGMFSMPQNFALGCPQGDEDDIVVEVALDAADVLSALSSDALTLSQPANGAALFFTEGPIVADSSTALVTPSNQHRTTLTLGSFRGCGVNSALVSLYGLPLGYAQINVRTFDLAPPYGVVEFYDFVAFATGSFCGCPPYSVAQPTPVTNDCRDFNNDGWLQIIDFSKFMAHYGHVTQYAAANARAEVSQSNASVALQITEEYPTATTHRLYVDVAVEGFDDVTTTLFALGTASERLAFAEWRQAENPLGDVMFAPIVRDRVPQHYFGAVVSESFTGSASHLGRLVFDVTGTEPFELTEGDFVLTYGEVLLESAGEAPVVAQMAGIMGRTLDPAVARIYHDRLEQNFPNPFNPTTTLAFSIKDAGNVSLTIYDVAGRRVRELLNEQRDRGAYKVVWDGQNDAGQIVASGVYFYKLIAGSFTDTKKMTILK